MISRSMCIYREMSTYTHIGKCAHLYRHGQDNISPKWALCLFHRVGSRCGHNKNSFWRAPVFDQEKKLHNFEGQVSRTAHQSFKIMCWIKTRFLNSQLATNCTIQKDSRADLCVFFLIKIDNVFLIFWSKVSLLLNSIYKRTPALTFEKNSQFFCEIFIRPRRAQRASLEEDFSKVRCRLFFISCIWEWSDFGEFSPAPPSQSPSLASLHGCRHPFSCCMSLTLDPEIYDKNKRVRVKERERGCNNFSLFWYFI